MDVLGRVELRERGVAEPVVGDAGEVDDGRDVGHREVADLHVVPVDQRRRTDQRVVTVPAGDLLERDAGPGARAGKNAETAISSWWTDDSSGPTYSSAAGMVRRPPGPSTSREPPSRREHDRHLGGRVGVHQGADRGAAVADRRVRDVGQRQRDQRLDPAYVGGGEHVGVPGQRPDPHAGLVDRDRVEARAGR